MALAAALAFPATAHARDLWTVYQTALAQDAAYRAAGYEYERARLALPLAESAFRPAVTLRGSAQHNDTGGSPAGATGSDSDQQINLNADLRVYDRALRGAVSQAELQAEAARLRLAQAHDALIIRVADRYFQLLAAVDGLEVARRQKASIQRQMHLTAERLRVGLGTETDLLDARARFQQAVSDEIQAADRIDNAAHALRQITGGATVGAGDAGATDGATVDAGDGDTVTDTGAAAAETTAENLAPLADDAPLPAPDPAAPGAWIAKALADNLGVRVATIDLAIARLEVTRQRAARWPNLTVSAGQRWRDSSAPPPSETDTTSVTATLNWPLHQRGAVHLRARQAAFQVNAAEQRLEERRRQVAADAASAYRAVASGISRVEALAEAVRAGAGSLRAKEDGFRAGLTTNIDVLDAQRDLSRSRTDYLGARYDFIRAVLRLERDAGDLDEADLRRVNAWLERD
ncbi:MAG: TolC family protein [Gammaproteobacteria bacterium]|nr:TolC family protein [Gammaproteobacteria bacterium]